MSALQTVADENEEFKQIKRNMTIASFSNKNKNARLGNVDSIEEHKYQVLKVSNVVDPIDLSSINYIPSSKDHFPSSRPESLNSENIDKDERIHDTYW